jgi:hypothetical protein
MIAQAAERFDAAGTLLDAHAQDLIRQLLRNLVAWSRLLHQGTGEVSDVKSRGTGFD